MGANQSAFEHDVIVVGVFDQVIEHLLLDSGLGPAGEAFVNGLVFAITARQVPPVSSGAQNPQNAVDKQSVILATTAGVARLAG